MKARQELNACLYTLNMDGNHMPSYHDEPAQYADIQNGNVDAVRLKLESGDMLLHSDMRILSDDTSRNTMYHFVLAASAIARACMKSGMGHDESYTLSDIYIRKADQCKRPDLICKLYKEMCLDFAERMCEIRKETVISLHIRKCIDYIYENLGGDLSVKALAEVTGLNPTYLSRLFSKETGTSLNQFVKEAKIDTAQNLLKYSDLSYLEISVTLGFSSQSAFIGIFKQITGTTPKMYREQYYCIENNESISSRKALMASPSAREPIIIQGHSDASFSAD